MEIIGAPWASIHDVKRWAREKKAHPRFVEEIIPALWKAVQNQAKVNGGRRVNPLVVIAQSAKETGWGKFGGVLDPSFHNTAGIKIAKGGGNFDPKAHERFASWDEGARAHVNHLAAYVGLNPVGEPHGRYHTVKRLPWAGTVKTVAQLGARWAPNPLYGRDVEKMAREIQPKAPVSPATGYRSRADWGAKAPKAYNALDKSKVTDIFIHHTTGSVPDPAAWLRSIQNYHMNTKGWNDIAYNFLVDKDGVAWEGRGWDAVGGHTKNHNSTSVAIAYLGEGGTLPSAAALATIKRLADEADRHFKKVLRRQGHRDVGQTACPGDALYGWVKAGMPV